jgi:uncharacterized membrane protein
MAHTHPSSIAAIADQPIYSMLVQFPIVCFALTLLTDLAYWWTGNLMWQNFSSWFLLIGLLVGVMAAIVGAIEASFSGAPALSYIWPYPIVGLIVLALAFVNSLVHAGDGWTAVVLWGPYLSALTVVAMVASYWARPGLCAEMPDRRSGTFVRPSLTGISSLAIRMRHNG